MENNLTIFEGQELEILTKKDVNFKFDGTVLFNGKQSATILKYKNDRDALHKHVRDEQKFKLKNSDVVNTKFRKLNNAGETFVTEVGIIELIQKSKNKSEDYKTKIKDWLVLNNLIQDKFVIETRKEIEFLDLLEDALKSFDLSCIRQYSVLNKYKIDLYIKDLKIAIEYDENEHKQYTYKQHEGRQKEIEKELGCKFIRVSDNESNAYNVGLVIKQIIKGMVA